MYIYIYIYIYIKTGQRLKVFSKIYSDSASRLFILLCTNSHALILFVKKFVLVGVFFPFFSVVLILFVG